MARAASTDTTNPPASQGTQTLARRSFLTGPPELAKSLKELHRLRLEAQRQIEKLIDLLDATDTDSDLEDGFDAEPSLGADARDLEEDNSDREPSLGWPERMCQGVDHGGGDDRELIDHASDLTAARRRYRKGQSNTGPIIAEWAVQS